MATPPEVAVVGTGPAGLMAADVLASLGCKVRVFEQRKHIGWKLYVAGGSGLNITHHMPDASFAAHYTGPDGFWLRCLDRFSSADWIRFIETSLGVKTFLGTSDRYFVTTMHAAKLLQQWKHRLNALGVSFYLNHPWEHCEVLPGGKLTLSFAHAPTYTPDAVCFALGGGSWLSSPSIPLRWPEKFLQYGIGMQPFEPSNTGYEVRWHEGFLKEAEGKPLKNIRLITSKGQKHGDLMVTAYGLEGTPIYFLGESGLAFLDLKPDMSYDQILTRLLKVKENLTPLRRVKKYLKLSEASIALLYHHTAPEARKDVTLLTQQVKRCPIHLIGPRPLSESISSKGGVLWSELDESLMLRRYPGIYCMGEMIDWDAPTGGFLIQGCISQGVWAARAVAKTFGLTHI